VLHGKLSSTVRNTHKQEAWARLLEAVNFVGSNQRSLKQVQDKMKNLKKRYKSAAANNSKEIRKTGGGESSVEEINRVGEKILSTMSTTTLHGIKGGFDSSAQRKCIYLTN